jgi:hypothetical protein
MPCHPSLVAALAVLAAAPLQAQRPVFTVGGTGADYATLTAAVAGAPPGAMLLVRSGAHTGFTTNKPLVVLLDFAAGSGATVSAAPGAPFAIRIDGLPAGQQFVLAGRLGGDCHGEEDAGEAPVRAGKPEKAKPAGPVPGLDAARVQTGQAGGR